MIKRSKILAIFLGIFVFLTNFGNWGDKIVFAETSKEEAVKGVINNIKENLNNLIAKNEEGDKNLNFKINAFREIINLSMEESKNYAEKLLTSGKEKEYDLWVEESLKKMTDILSHLKELEKYLDENEGKIIAEDIKKITLDFQNWRKETYLPLLEQLQDFFLIKQEFEAIQTANKRLNNIKKDLEKLRGIFKKADTAFIEKQLSSSTENIKGAEELNKNALSIFLEKYVDPLRKKVEESSASTSEASSFASSTNSSSSLENVTTTSLNKDASNASATDAIINKENKDKKVEEASATSSSDSNESINPKPEIVSIKYLVGASLDKIKSAYQNFIEISNYVRKLLK